MSTSEMPGGWIPNTFFEGERVPERRTGHVVHVLSEDGSWRACVRSATNAMWISGVHVAPTRSEAVAWGRGYAVGHYAGNDEAERPLRRLCERTLHERDEARAALVSVVRERDAARLELAALRPLHERASSLVDAIEAYLECEGAPGDELAREALCSGLAAYRAGR
jgi:hypothetical protein